MEINMDIVCPENADFLAQICGLQECSVFFVLILDETSIIYVK